MNDPINEVEGVIRGLTQTPPSEQREYIETYFTPDASFVHPFCRTGSWANSRFLIRAIYRWYKIMSPHIDLTVHSIAYDEKNLKMYVNISQVFKIWAVPFYAAHVELVTVLQLRRHYLPAPPTSEAAKPDASPTKYYIQSQNDLYQVNQFIRFIWPFPTFFVWAWQMWATFFCLLGALAFWPLSVLEETGMVGSGARNSGDVSRKAGTLVNGTSVTSNGKDHGLLEEPKGSGHYITAPAVQQR